MRFDSALGIELSRLEVDFFIQDLTQDSRLAIDPFLMFKSRYSGLAAWHSKLLAYFNHVLGLIRVGELDASAHALTCPEVREIRLGYTEAGTQGAGIGPGLAADIIQLFQANEALIDRGLRHLEELQLYSVGVGSDRTRVGFGGERMGRYRH